MRLRCCWGRSLIAWIISVSLVSCGPTYPKERLVESLVDLCKKEYGIEVKAQVVDNTLGVLFHVPGLMDELRKHASSAPPPLPTIWVAGQFDQRAFDFHFLAQGPFVREDEPADQPNRKRDDDEPEPFRKIRQVSLAVMRVAMSTDAKIEFYRLIARDPGPDKMDWVNVRYIEDAKRMWQVAVPLNELYMRNELLLRYQPEAVAVRTVEQFLSDLGRRSISQLLSRYVATSRRFGELLPAMLAIASAVEEEEARRLVQHAAEWPVRQIADDTVLVYVPLADSKGADALLFSVKVDEASGKMEDIQLLDAGRLPPRYRSLGDPAHWKDFFYLKPVSLPQFLTDQIAKRVRAKFKPLDAQSKEALNDKKRVRPPVPATSEDVTRALVETAAYVVKSYRFRDFDKVSITDLMKKTRWEVPAATLPLYQQKNAPKLVPIS